MRTSYILSAARTPIGRMLGGLASQTAPQLGAVAIRAAIQRGEIDPDSVDEIILGNVLSAGVGQAPARQAALRAGLSEQAPALTINKVCGSGLKAVILADQIIRAGDANLVVAGGMESMSRAPHLLNGGRRGWKLGHQEVSDSLLRDGLWCAVEDAAMGDLAEQLAADRAISRQEQDEYASSSHQRAIAAVQEGRFELEISPVSTDTREGERDVELDEGPRIGASAETLSGLRPAFKPEGTVTAGNASQISDGAAALIVASEAVVEKRQAPVLARIVGSTSVSLSPRDLFVAPVRAIQRLLQQAELGVEDVDLFELNEAFAAQSLACIRELNLDPQRVNVNGGAIALGHPIGASGARILVTLLHEMQRREAKRGVAALCLGGGGAVAMLVERQ